MYDKSSTTNKQGAKVLFIDFMQWPIAKRKAYIEKHAPNMLEAQKRAVLH